jgi:ATP-dependent DNA helicase DinG
MPYMILRLRQGIGRLIRSEEDKGMVHILLDDDLDSQILEGIKQVLPVKPTEC